MLSPTTAFYVMDEERLTDCISDIQDVSPASHELGRSEFKKVEALKSRKRI